MQDRLTIINLDSIEAVRTDEVLRKTPISPTTTGNSCFKVIWFTGKNGKVYPQGQAHKGEELVFVLQGEAIMTAYGIEHELKANDSVIIPEGVAHSLNITKEPFVGLSVFCDECKVRCGSQQDDALGASS